MTRQRVTGIKLVLIGAAGLVSLAAPACLTAQDWPMWRYDAARSAAATKNRLPEGLQPAWSLTLGAREQVWDDPLNHDLMTYDRILEPIVVGERLIVGFNDAAKVVAYDTASGGVAWTAFAEAPVRLPPAGWRERVFFCSDDGTLYCVDLVDGTLRWKFSGAPYAQKAIGNGRLVSAWPARGGPVVRDGIVYFAASIWPFMGTFVYALDADSGAVLWVNDETGAQYIKQPHSAPSFAGVAPQGALVATDQLLIVPGGRSVPAVFSRADGRLQYFEINAGGKGTGGSFVAATDRHFYVHTRHKGTRQFQLSDGVKTAFTPNEPVLWQGHVYAAERVDDEPRLYCYDEEGNAVWQLPVDGTGDLILAGDQLVAVGGGKLTAIGLSHDGKQAQIDAHYPAPDDIQRLLVGDQRLFAVGLQGTIHCYDDQGGHRSLDEVVTAEPVESESAAPVDWAEMISRGSPEGYALWFGNCQADGAWRLASGTVAVGSDFCQVALIDPEAERVQAMRRTLDTAGLHGAVTAHHADPLAFRAPSYVAHMVFLDCQALRPEPELVGELYRSVRPYGGMLYLVGVSDADALAERVRQFDLEQADVSAGAGYVALRRVGKLPGAADWTHQYGNIANTVKSDDARVKLPLGVLWFGGSSNLDVLPRHGHGPPEQVVDGRLFIQGMNSLSCRDVYTGRVLWKREFENLGTYDVYFDETYEDTPLNPQYNQVHIPGANARGTNYVVTGDRIYLLEGPKCHLIDPATGETLAEFMVPATAQDDGQPQWGYIGVYEDILLGGVGFANYRTQHGLSFEEDEKLRRNHAGFGSKSFDRAASRAVVGLDRHSGELLWRVDAHNSFWHNGIVAGGGRVYLLDRNPTKVEEKLRRRGLSDSENYRIVTLDARTGQQQWEVTEGIFGTWLGYSERFDLLLHAGAAASDRLYGEPTQGMTVYRGTDGSVQWTDMERRYSGPCILHNDLIITNTNAYSHSAGAFYISDGKPLMVPHPLTGEPQPWTLTRAYGCNNIIASENMLTFRSGAAGFYDLQSRSGTGNLGGFKSGCTSNLVAANGVLNAPDYTRTCSCAYQNQTSLALVHMPEMDMWSASSLAAADVEGKRIQHLGLNFGAPGDRRDPDGLLWLEYPITGGTSPPLHVEVNADAEFYQDHTSTKLSTDLPWVRASGVRNLTEMQIGITLREKPEQASPSDSEPGKYRLVLLLAPADPDAAAVVNLWVQDEQAADQLALSADGIRHTVENVRIVEVLHTRFECEQGSFVLQGIELERQGE